MGLVKVIRRRDTGPLRATVGLLVLALLWPLAVAANSSPINVDAEHIAVSGYDLLGYFEDHVERGSKDFSAEYRGATYLFSSAAHLALFEADPQRYLPAYGGYCAYGISMGKRLSIDPASYEIVAGRLYFLLNRVTQKTWLLDRDLNIARADRLWGEMEGPR